MNNTIFNLQDEVNRRLSGNRYADLQWDGDVAVLEIKELGPDGIAVHGRFREPTERDIEEMLLV